MNLWIIHSCIINIACFRNCHCSELYLQSSIRTEGSEVSGHRPSNAGQSERIEKQTIIVGAKVQVLLEVDQNEYIQRNNVDHQVLCCNEFRQHESIELAQFFGVHVVPCEYDVSMVHTVGDVEEAITESEVNHKPFTLCPGEERLDTLQSERCNQDSNNWYKT